MDELKDMLASADSSKAALFVIGGFLCTGNKIMTDDTETTLTVSENAPQNGGVHISPGVFIHNIVGENKAGQIDSTQLVNILANIGGWGGPGLAAGVSERWDLICVANAEKDDYPENRWFVDDSVTPNTYAENLTNTLINKAYYDIQVVHCTPGAGFDQPVPPGYFCIAEVLVPAGAVIITDANIFDTTGLSYNPAPSWDASTRVLRLEYGASVFRVDHDPLTGFHRVGAWHIGPDVVTATGTEINKALHFIGATVTAANLTKLTDNSVLPAGTLHSHTGGPQQYILIQDEKPSGTAGGTFNNNAWQTRDLNIVKWDDTGQVLPTLAGNRFTLPAGTYVCNISAPGRDVNHHKTRLRNITEGVTTLVGSSEDTTTVNTTRSFIIGKFTIAIPTVFEVQHYCMTQRTTQGFGYPCSFGEVEIYAIAQFWKC